MQIFRHTLRGEAEHVGIALSTRQLDAFCQHYELLLKWNPRIRLVATTDPARAARELFADSLVLARFVERYAAEPPGTGTSGSDVPQMVDIGAGAGLVGIPLKILWPHWGLVVIDSHAKKIAFTKTAARQLALTSVRDVRGRAEEVAHRGDFRERFDLAFCRAVGPPPLACELAVPFLKVGGSFIVQAGEPRSSMEPYEGPKDL
ncbi:MAG: 16S rRNA (guanine(527)-N(7))-methyltransferase RsmG, partial [Candidatus Hydrogenedentota bacterium]